MANREWRKPLAVLYLWLCAAAAAAQPYPDRPIRFIVPYAPGGSSDVIARLLGPRLAQDMGQLFLVDNRPGAGSMLGTELVAKAAPDGYTIILSDMPHAINPSVYGKVPYDPVTDFSAITRVGTSAMFLFVHPSLPASSLREFVALARTRAGSLAIGSGGNGTTTHLVAEILQVRAGIKLTHVPYKGAGPALIDVATGQIPATFTSMATAASLVRAGKLRVLGVTSPKRIAAFPDVPTFAEGGISGFVVEHWWGVLAPAGVASTIVSRLHDAIVRTVGTSEMRERFEVLAVEPRTEFPKEFQAFLAAEVRRWAKVVSDTGVKIN